MTIKRRLAVLENAAGDLSRFIVAIGPAGFDYEAEFRRRRGVARTKLDLLLVVSKPKRGAAHTVTVDGVSRALA
ncbi:hypothetical protein QP164_00145 [Sphingomonas sp. LR59]|uniref:hypothetical protein n=1 Tax=Sphingomonas sp. LR59 TaxID=3050232 RepID=UPI002FE1E174